MDRINGANYATDGSGRRVFQDKNLGTNTPGTSLVALWHTDAQEEIVRIIEASGQVPTAGVYQLLQAIGWLAGPFGHCRLGLVSSTQISLKPYQGNRLTINGISYPVPQAGVSLANTGLAANTFYYVYAFVAAGVLTLEAVTTTHATDATALNYGVEIKSGDSSRTLVGALYTDASSHFVNSATNRSLLNWFNRQGLSLNGSFVTAGLTSSTFVTIGSTGDLFFLTWADEAVQLNMGGTAANNTAGQTCLVSFGIDGTFNQGAGSTGTSASGGAYQPVTVTGCANFSEGILHHVQPGGLVSAGTGTFSVGMTGYFRG